jgi:hypothetical protein
MYAAAASPILLTKVTITFGVVGHLRKACSVHAMSAGAAEVERRIKKLRQGFNQLSA